MEGASEAGASVIAIPFIAIQPIRGDKKKAEIKKWLSHPEPVALVFTSKYAVQFTFEPFSKSGMPGEQHRKIYCLGGVTKEYVARLAGEENIIGVATNAAELAEKIIRQEKYKNILFFCGDKRREDLPSLLKAAGINITEIPVYETTLTPVVVNEHLQGAVFFSPSAVESFFSVNKPDADTIYFAIGPTTASALKAIAPNPVVVSDRPDEEELMQTVWSYFKN